MRRIFKYKLGFVETQTIDMPTNAKILSVQAQGGNICIWAEVEEYYVSHRTFRIFGTGHPIPDVSLNYIGTIQTDEFVWHVYEENA